MSKQTDSESSKNIDPGEILQVGLTDGRRPRGHYPWGTASARCRRRRIHAL